VQEFGFLRREGRWTGLRLGGAEVDISSERGVEGLFGTGRFHARLVLELAGPGAALTAHNSEPLAADEGPERCALRVPVTFRDSDGGYCGDGLQEISALADGTLLLGLGVRVLRPADHGGVRAVGWRLSLGEGVRIAATAAAAGRMAPETQPRACRFEEVGDWAVLSAGERFVGVYWGRELEGWADPLGGEGVWAKVGDGERAPFYHGWENYLRQWHGPRGWRARGGARVLLQPDGLLLAWHAGPGAELAPLDPEPGMHFSGAVALLPAATEAEARRRLEALAAPLVPRADGARVAGFDYLEGSYRVRRTGERCRVTFPPDPLARRVLLRADGPPAAAVACRAGGKAIRPQLVSVGRVDDPYGPHEGRPDSGGRPTLAAFERPAERVELGVELSESEPTVVEVADSDGVSLSYLAQDERRELLIFSSLAPERPLGRLSLGDLKLRGLRLPGASRAAVAVLPLHWFLMNAPSRYHSASRLEAWEIAENGPDAVRLRLTALNPGGNVRSSVEMHLPRPESGLLRLEVATRLEVLGEFAVPHFQFCNLFPEPGRQPADWSYAETLAVAGDRTWVVENRAPVEEAAEGERFREFRPPFFLAQYAAEGGNFALLVTAAEPAEAALGYELCRCWLDNHLFVCFPEGGPPVGARYAVDYQLALWGGEHTSRKEVKELAAASLASGRLEL